MRTALLIGAGVAALVAFAAPAHAADSQPCEPTAAAAASTALTPCEPTPCTQTAAAPCDN